MGRIEVALGRSVARAREGGSATNSVRNVSCVLYKLFPSVAMCAVGLRLLGLYLVGIAVCAAGGAFVMMGAAVVAAQLAIPMLLSCAAVWIISLMYQMLCPSEPAFLVLEPSAPELPLLASQVYVLRFVCLVSQAPPQKDSNFESSRYPTLHIGSSIVLCDQN